MNQYIKTTFKHSLTYFKFSDDNVYFFFNDIKQLGDYVKTINLSTRKQVGKTIQLIYAKFYNDEMKAIAKSWTDNTGPEGMIQTQNNKIYKDISIANETIEKIELDYQIRKEVFDEIKEEENFEFEYNSNHQTLVIESIIKYIGVLRPSELQSIRIIDNDTQETFDNYINITNKEMVISKHKTSETKGPRIIKLKNDFIELCKCGLNKWLLCDDEGEQVKDAYSYLKELLNINCSYYELRHMKTSVYIKTGDMSLIDTLSHNQGHDIQTQLTYYTTYI